MQNIRENFRLLIAVLIVGLLLGWIFFHSSDHSLTNGKEATVTEEHDHAADQATIWTCSMHPQIRRDKPGKCPICGMELVPLNSLSAGEAQTNPDELVMTESAAKLAEVQTTIVKRGTPQKSLYLQGKVQADERNQAELTARFGGRIEKLYVNFTGQQVKKGERLVSIYSPELVTAQRELLEAAGYRETRPSLYLAAKGKLKLWDLTDEQIASIEEKGKPQTYFDVSSPISGTVMKRHIALGDYVKEGMPLFQVVDLSRVWVLFDAYENDLPWIKKGDRAEFTIQSLPGKIHTGRVSFIDPVIDASTRVAKVRVELNNPGLKIKPEMFVNGTIQSEIAMKGNDLLIPKTAVLWTGKRAVVYVKVPGRKNPTFLYRQIILGPEAGNFYVVANGLSEGEEIASNGVFRIDAAAQLQGLPSMMSPQENTEAPKPGQMDMDTEPGPATETSAKIPGTAKDVPETFRKQLTSVFNHYLKMKDAFFASDAQKVRTAAREVRKSLDAVNMELLSGDVHMTWMKQLNPMKNFLNTIIQTSDIEQQRKEFAGFNLVFYKSIKTFGLKDTAVYYQYCPMAGNNQGAYWFSASKEIRNPYLGEAMPGCGETRETLH